MLPATWFTTAADSWHLDLSPIGRMVMQLLATIVSIAASRSRVILWTLSSGHSDQVRYIYY